MPYSFPSKQNLLYIVKILAFIIAVTKYGKGIQGRKASLIHLNSSGRRESTIVKELPTDQFEVTLNSQSGRRPAVSTGAYCLPPFHWSSTSASDMLWFTVHVGFLSQLN